VGYTHLLAKTYLTGRALVLPKFFPETNVKLYLAAQQSQHHAILLTATALLLSLGFLIGNPVDQHNYIALYQLMSNMAWSFCFFVYAVIKFFQALKLIATTWTVIASMCLGVWLWSAIFVSSIILDPHAVAPTEFLLVTPLLLEVYQLAIDLYRCIQQRQK